MYAQHAAKQIIRPSAKNSERPRYFVSDYDAGNEMGTYTGDHFLEIHLKFHEILTAVWCLFIHGSTSVFLFCGISVVLFDVLVISRCHNTLFLSSPYL